MTVTAHPSVSIKGPVITGFLVITLFFLVMGGWAAQARLTGAVVVPGYIKVVSDRQPIKNQTSAIVAEVLVTEGQEVVPDQVLLRLDDIQTRSLVEQLTGEIDTLSAEQARLVAERDGSAEITFPERLVARASTPAIARLTAQQRQLFDSRRRALEGQTNLLRQTIRQLEDQIVGKRAERTSQDRQLELIQQETEDTRTLFNKGYAPKTKLLALERAGAALEGTRGSLDSAIAEAEKGIEEQRLRMAQLEKDWRAEIDTELGKVRKDIADVEPRLRAASHQLGLTEIRAPVGGRILSLLVRSPGRVIQPSDVLMEIVPTSQALVVEASIKPEDINDVEPGMAADVKLTAFNQRVMPRLSATVDQVSADRLMDAHSGQPFYQVQLTIHPDDIEKASKTLGQRVSLLPGMPTQVAIATRERTVLDYLLSPVMDGIDRAMREK